MKKLNVVVQSYWIFGKFLATFLHSTVQKIRKVRRSLGQSNDPKQKMTSCFDACFLHYLYVDIEKTSNAQCLYSDIENASNSSNAHQNPLKEFMASELASKTGVCLSLLVVDLPKKFCIFYPNLQFHCPRVINV